MYIFCNPLYSEAYRSALQAFLERRREPGEGSEASQSPNSSPAGNNRVEIFSKNTNSEKRPEERQIIPGVPHVDASEVFEVGWVAGTEDRYLELIAAEWQHTRTALRRSSHPDCFTAVRADLDILTLAQILHSICTNSVLTGLRHAILNQLKTTFCFLSFYAAKSGTLTRCFLWEQRVRTNTVSLRYLSRLTAPFTTTFTSRENELAFKERRDAPVKSPTLLGTPTLGESSTGRLALTAYS